jgi:hypothetical protein
MVASVLIVFRSSFFLTVGWFQPLKNFHLQARQRVNQRSVETLTDLLVRARFFSRSAGSFENWEMKTGK